jgi:hypothetical protein
MAQDHELLVMRAARPYPHAEQAAAARGLDLLSRRFSVWLKRIRSR